MVVQKLVSPGQLIQAGSTVCFVLSDVSTVWVQGHIFDRDLPSVRVGDPVEETNPALRRAPFTARCPMSGRLVDPATRTTPVRIVTQNPEGLLKKDMFVEAVIHTGGREQCPGGAGFGRAARRRRTSRSCMWRAQPGKFAQRLVTRSGAQQDGPGGDPQRAAGRARQVVSEGSLFLQFANSYSIRPPNDRPHRFFRALAAVPDRDGVADALMVWGALSFQKLPIDAYPDLSPPHVEIITQWPGHAAEEVERLVTIPIEIEMNGIPQLEALRSISLYGLSSVQMNFEYGADPVLRAGAGVRAHGQRARCPPG